MGNYQAFLFINGLVNGVLYLSVVAEKAGIGKYINCYCVFQGNLTSASSSNLPVVPFQSSVDGEGATTVALGYLPHGSRVMVVVVSYFEIATICALSEATLAFFPGTAWKRTGIAIFP